MTNDKVKIEIKKESIKNSASAIDMMISTGALYKEHPVVLLLEEIVDECIKLKKEDK